jgi:hypothetical protein
MMGVFSPSTSHAYGSVLTFGSTYGIFYYGAVHKLGYYYNGDFPDTTVLTEGTQYVFTINIPSSLSVTFFINGVIGRTATPFGGLEASFNTIGNDNSGEAFGGLISELRVWPSMLSTANQQKAETYLGYKYGITITH